MNSPTVLLFGIPSEAPLKLVTEALHRLRVDAHVVDQRQCESSRIEFRLDGDTLSGTLRVDNRTVQLASVAGVYVRLMDGAVLPGASESPMAAARIERWHAAVTNWLELFDGRIVNRLSAMASNASKPYQSQLLQAHGFSVPETLVTNDPEEVRNFLAEHTRAIFHPTSGVRSIVQEFRPEHLAQLDRIRACPTQFQRLIDGTNVRVHVVGTGVCPRR